MCRDVRYKMDERKLLELKLNLIKEFTEVSMDGHDNWGHLKLLCVIILNYIDASEEPMPQAKKISHYVVKF